MVERRGNVGNSRHHHRRRRADRRKSPTAKRRLWVESLEERQMLSGTSATATAAPRPPDSSPGHVAPAQPAQGQGISPLTHLTPAFSTGTWAEMTNLPPQAIETMILLSDGQVMAQGANLSGSQVSKQWYALTPSSTGSYAAGTWSSLASMGTARLYFPSEVLPSGDVFVAGGEYSGSMGAMNETNTGEIYNPVANTWTPIPNFPQSALGDDPSEMLPGGQVLVGYQNGPQTYIYNPSTNGWTQTGTKLYGDDSDEENWVLLPGGDVLAYAISASPDSGPGFAQYYVPSTGQWQATGSVPVPLTNSSSSELGPAFLLANGEVFQLGATGNTALYTPSTNSWAAGPVIPNGEGTDDAPGAVLPDGNVFFTADFPGYTPPAQLYDYDPVQNKITAVTGLPTKLTNELNQSPAYSGRMLVLPTGQLMFVTGEANTVWLYTPTDTPVAAGKPTVSSVSLNSDGTYTLTGTLLNGISEGAAYGDDAEMSSNYPIVRLTSSGGQVYYARTFNWSNTGVATGSASVTTQFALPSGLPVGSYTLNVIANGIASANFSFATAFVVASSTPAAGSVDSTPPTSYVINFSNPVTPSSVQASDLQVNGKAASGVSLNGADTTATFTFFTNPVTTAGSQTMSIAAGAILRASDSSGLLAFNASFVYDNQPQIAVVSTTPASGSTLTPPLTSLVVQFNEAYAPATISPSNLTLSHGTVTQATQTNSTTVTYTISGVTSSQNLTFSIPAGAVTDVYGGPNSAYTGTLTIESAPQVAAVYVSGGSAWSAGFYQYLSNEGLGGSLGYSVPGGLNQLRILPWDDLTTISVVFTENVVVNTSQTGLALVGSPDLPPIPSLSAAAFSYSSATDTATWTFSNPLTVDKYLLCIPSAAVANTGGIALDGDWTNTVGDTAGSSFPSGNGTPGGDFDFRFNVVPGNVSLGGVVTGADGSTVRLNLGEATNAAAYSPFADIDGSGTIDSADMAGVRAALLQRLPQTEPTVPGNQHGSALPPVGSGSLAAAVSPTAPAPAKPAAHTSTQASNTSSGISAPGDPRPDKSGKRSAHRSLAPDDQLAAIHDALLEGFDGLKSWE